MNQNPKPFRPNSGIVVFNNQRLVLAGERLDTPGYWQLPQGGIDSGETPKEAAIRELYEEIGLKMSAPDMEFSEWLAYIFPENISEGLKGYCGQRQKWFFYHWEGDPLKLDLKTHEQEFGKVEWKSLAFLVKQIVAFKKEVYQQLELNGLPIIEEFLSNTKC